MEIVKHNNGFPYAWKAGRVEQLIRSILESKTKQQLGLNKVMIINPTWMHEDNIAKDIAENDPDFIICHNFVDPAVSKIFEQVQKSGRPYVILGNAEQFRLDFWAMVCDLYFQNYEERDLGVTVTAKKFICLNRKPHPHRRIIVDNLLPYKDQGFISLGTPENPIVLEEEFAEHQGIADEYGNLGVDESIVTRHIKNDIFSLGNLNTWNNSVLCIVTETEFSNANPMDFFISEKTWKPIIGMRPFFVYGQPQLREYLKSNGFDVFEDVFDYSIIDENLGDVGKQLAYSQVAVNAINKIENPHSTYLQLFGRCQANKKRFSAYAYEQWDKLYKLNLADYV
jgi:hypothetical protein